MALCDENTVTEKMDVNMNGTNEEKTAQNVAMKEERPDALPTAVGADSVKVEENVVDDKKNPYLYLKDEEYSCERFKVVVESVPPKMTFAQLKKYFTNRLGYAPRKVKHQYNTEYCYLAFRNDEEREMAIEKLNGLVWRNKTITCKKAAPAKDPFLNNRKRKNLDPEEEERRSKIQALPYIDRVPHTVCPWFEVPYEEQLSRKQNEAEQLLKDLTYKLKKDECVDEQWVKDLKFNTLPCELLPIIGAPKKVHYRTKNEFSIGLGAENKDNTLGFRLGKYSEGCRIVVEPTKAVIVPEVSLTVAKEFQEYLLKQDLASHDLREHTGYWQQLTVRCVSDESNPNPETMVIAQMHRQSLTEEQLKEVKSNLVSHFMSEEREAKVSSVYFSYSTANNNNIDVYEHLAGQEYIHQDMLGLKFRISCDSFFQVNVSAAELLYKKVIDWVEEEAKSKEISHVLDVCCGTGTIGLSIAKNLPNCKIVGVDCCERAIHDALANRSLNNVENADFACGTAESTLQRLVQEQKNKGTMIAVVDPPRAGLHRSVVMLLREQKSIEKVIFVSCSPKQAMGNFLELMRFKSKKRPGGPFRLTRAIPVDLFPQTPHCEMILEFTRLPPKAKFIPVANKAASEISHVLTEQGSVIDKESVPPSTTI